MEDRYDIRVDVGEGKDWWYVHGLATHDKVYELNRQMFDLGKTMNDPMKPLSEEAAQEIAKALEITRNPKGIIMEKKTKKMTKAEAFEYLKGKKILVDCHPNVILKKLFDIGLKWVTGNTEIGDWNEFEMYGLVNQDNGLVWYHQYTTDSKMKFESLDSEKILASDILSIEIVDGEDNIAEKNAFQQARDIMKWLREEQSPHTLMIIDGYHVELLDGVKAEVWKE